MTKVLYFNSETDAELIKAKMKDGEIIIGEKKFSVDTARHINLRRAIGVEPLYLLKWDCIFGGNVKSQVTERKLELAEIKKVIEGGTPMERNIISTVVFTRDAKNIPESLYKTERLKIVGGMFHIKKDRGLLPVIFGLIVGSVVVFLLFYFKLFKL
jgi:hypothetical protein